MVDLRTEFAGIRLKNPVMTASGTFGYGAEFSRLVDLNRLGGIVVKGLSVEPMAGAEGPRLHGTAMGMMNAVGLQNVGVGEFVSSKLPLLRDYRTRVFANVFGFTTEEYVQVVEVLNQSEGLAGYELNISCPNVKSGGLMYGSDPGATREVVEAVKLRARRPVLVKLSPNVTDIRELARAAEDGGADALSLVNTLTGMSVDVESLRPRLGNITGGLSGPAIKPVALRMVYEVVRTVGIPVVAIGGIRTAEDALEYLIVGARAVQVGTANFVDPQAPLKVIRGLGDYCRRKGFPSIRSVIGRLRAD